MSPKARPARASDVDEIAASLPEAELGISWDDRPTWKVRGKGFLIYRMPHKTAVDPVTGEMWDDILVVGAGCYEASSGRFAAITAQVQRPHWSRLESILDELSPDDWESRETPQDGTARLRR